MYHKKKEKMMGKNPRWGWRRGEFFPAMGNRAGMGGGDGEGDYTLRPRPAPLPFLLRGAAFP